MKLSFRDVLSRGVPVVAVVQSLDQALYQVLVVSDGQECLLTENDGKIFCRNSLSAVREALQLLPLASLSLRHQSAYDEMVGQPSREQDNTLEVPLSLDLYPPVTRH